MAAKKTAKRKPSAAFMKLMQPDAALSAVIGDKPVQKAMDDLAVVINKILNE